jgi:hypothetical protein
MPRLSHRAIVLVSAAGLWSGAANALERTGAPEPESAPAQATPKPAPIDLERLARTPRRGQPMPAPGAQPTSAADKAAEAARKAEQAKRDEAARKAVPATTPEAAAAEYAKQAARERLEAEARAPREKPAPAPVPAAKPPTPSTHAAPEVKLESPPVTMPAVPAPLHPEAYARRARPGSAGSGGRLDDGASGVARGAGGVPVDPFAERFPGLSRRDAGVKVVGVSGEGGVEVRRVFFGSTVLVDKWRVPREGFAAMGIVEVRTGAEREVTLSVDRVTVVVGGETRVRIGRLDPELPERSADGANGSGGAGGAVAAPSRLVVELFEGSVVVRPPVGGASGAGVFAPILVVASDRVVAVTGPLRIDTGRGLGTLVTAEEP